MAIFGLEILTILIDAFWTTGTTAPFKTDLPRPRDFSRALYTIDIGQNDLAYGFQHTNEAQVLASIPDILKQFSAAVKVSNISWLSSSKGFITVISANICLNSCFSNCTMKGRDSSGYITWVQLGACRIVLSITDQTPVI